MKGTLGRAGGYIRKFPGREQVQGPVVPESGLWGGLGGSLGLPPSHGSDGFEA